MIKMFYYLFSSVLFFAIAPFSFASLPYHHATYDGTGAVVSQTRYVYDGWQLVQEIDTLTDTVIAEYVYGPGYIDDVVQSKRSGNTYYHHTDQQYSTVAVTDASGNVVDRYGYDAFGNPDIYEATGTALPASAINNPVLYTGRAWQPELGLYDYRNRMYDPNTGRFTTPDPLGAHGDWNNLGNAYTYVGNNPGRYQDPLGLWGWDADYIQYGLGGLLGFHGSTGQVWKGAGVGALQGAAVGIDTPAMIPEWLGWGERPLKYLGAYEDTDPGIGVARAAAGVGWGAGIGSGGVAALAPNLGTASLASPSALYTASWLDALSLGTGISATGLTAKEALRKSSRSLAQRPGQAMRAITTSGTQGKFQNTPAMANSFPKTVTSKSGLRGSPSTFYTYDELKLLIRRSKLSGKGKGIEAHHLLEKRFASNLGVREGDILSVPVTPQWHRNVGKMGRNFHATINSQLKSMGTSPGTASLKQIWQVHKNVYDRLGYSEWASAIYKAYFGPRGIPY